VTGLTVPMEAGCTRESSSDRMWRSALLPIMHNIIDVAGGPPAGPGRVGSRPSKREVADRIAR
jgi:hypothetical protein